MKCHDYEHYPGECPLLTSCSPVRQALFLQMRPLVFSTKGFWGYTLCMNAR